MANGVQAYIGLGSNLDTPLTQVQRAFEQLSALPETQLIARSQLYRSRAVGPGQQPDYINAAALLETRLEAHRLLDLLQGIEQDHGRVRREHWGPRTLDLDLLLYGDEHIATERLSVPHLYLAERNFVLYPLRDITPDLVLPFGKSLESLLRHCSNDGLEALSNKEQQVLKAQEIKNQDVNNQEVNNRLNSEPQE